MGRALLRLTAFPRVHVIPVLTQGDEQGVYQIGSPVEFIPPLSGSDLVFACGAPGMVKAVQEIALAEGAPCFADAFESMPAHATLSLATRAREWLASLPLRRAG
jgi:3-phenylpropionate/trans-cinnamate dioxygenase ferredoxin reductase subunit